MNAATQLASEVGTAPACAAIGVAPLCANMTETLAPLFITVEGQEGTSHGKDHERPLAPGGQRP